MRYQKIKKAIFLERPNRFIANVELDGATEVCHVKNTGRCRELLVPGRTVFIEQSDNPNRKTKYDLIAADKDGLLINMDSQAPNKVAVEWIEQGGIYKKEDIVLIKPEKKYRNSRFDIYVESRQEKAFIEVKGVTLERDGVAAFPDAPTERGLKHIYELIDCAKHGYKAYILFVIQLKGAKYFIPNDNTQPEFHKALKEAETEGVKILAYECEVEPDLLKITEPVEVRL